MQPVMRTLDLQEYIMKGKLKTALEPYADIVAWCSLCGPGVVNPRSLSYRDSSSAILGPTSSMHQPYIRSISDHLRSSHECNQGSAQPGVLSISHSQGCLEILEVRIQPAQLEHEDHGEPA